MSPVLERYLPDHIAPLEVWEATTSWGRLYDAQGGPHFEAALAQVVRRLVEQHAPDALMVTGGRTETRGLLAGLRSITVEHGLPLQVPQPPRSAAMLTLHQRRGPQELWVDLGQSALKLAGAAGPLLVERDLSRAPLGDADQAPSPAACRSTRTWLLETLAPHCRPDTALHLGLPCEVHPDLSLGSCTYAWPRGDTRLLPCLAEGLQVRRLVAMNDAVLAAEALLPAPSVSTLLLTLGTGVGAAFVRPA